MCGSNEDKSCTRVKWPDSKDSSTLNVGQTRIRAVQELSDQIWKTVQLSTRSQTRMRAVREISDQIRKTVQLSARSNEDESCTRVKWPDSKDSSTLNVVKRGWELYESWGTRFERQLNSQRGQTRMRAVRELSDQIRKTVQLSTWSNEDESCTRVEGPDLKDSSTLNAIKRGWELYESWGTRFERQLNSQRGQTRMRAVTRVEWPELDENLFNSCARGSNEDENSVTLDKSHSTNMWNSHQLSLKFWTCLKVIENVQESMRVRYKLADESESFNSCQLLSTRVNSRVRFDPG